MKYITILLFINSILNIPALADDLTFENRAACARDSKLPSASAFLVVDSYNAGKQIDSYLKGNQLDPNNMTVEQGLKLFRLSLTETWMTITQELLNGRLPLLKANPELSYLEQNYSNTIKICQNHFPCIEMDQYIASIFSKWKSIPKNEPHPYNSYFEIDQFANSPELLKGRSQPQSSCLYVKRFSELQSNWNHDRPDQALLQKIALANNSKKDLFTDCFDDSDSISSRRFILQFDISEASKRTWKRNGFDFWYSLKLYFSYAWRHPDIILESVHPLNLVFKDLAIEQMIQLISTGCNSIERPECTQSQVSMDVFRSLGKLDSSTELDKPLPDRPEQVLIRDGMDVHRSDSGILPENEDSELWIKGYQERLIQRRGLLKQKLLLAISQFELLSNSITPTSISNELNVLKSKMNTNDEIYQKLQVLCSEIDMAARPEVNLLEKRFETTLEISKFKRLVEGSTDQQLDGMIHFYKSIAAATFPFCEQIRIEKIWKNSTSVQKSAYSSWFRDLSGTWDDPTPDFLGMGSLYNKNNSLTPVFFHKKK